MKQTDSILSSIRKFLNIGEDDTVFDSELIPHILASIGALSQNGVAKAQMITETTVWTDIINPEVLDDPEVMTMVPLYIMLSTKILFDPPPPSNVQYYATRIDETLWRLKIIYDSKMKEVL